MSGQEEGRPPPPFLNPDPFSHYHPRNKSNTARTDLSGRVPVFEQGPTPPASQRTLPPLELSTDPPPATNTQQGYSAQSYASGSGSASTIFIAPIHTEPSGTNYTGITLPPIQTPEEYHANTGPVYPAQPHISTEYINAGAQQPFEGHPAASRAPPGSQPSSSIPEEAEVRHTVQDIVNSVDNVLYNKLKSPQRKKLCDQHNILNQLPLPGRPDQLLNAIMRHVSLDRARRLETIEKFEDELKKYLEGLIAKPSNRELTNATIRVERDNDRYSQGGGRGVFRV